MVLQVILETVSQEKLQKVRIKLSRSYLIQETKGLLKFIFPIVYYWCYISNGMEWKRAMSMLENAGVGKGQWG